MLSPAVAQTGQKVFVRIKLCLYYTTCLEGVEGERGCPPSLNTKLNKQRQDL